jgi:hypothetical protein
MRWLLAVRASQLPAPPTATSWHEAHWRCSCTGRAAQTTAQAMRRRRRRRAVATAHVAAATEQRCVTHGGAGGAVVVVGWHWPQLAGWPAPIAVAQRGRGLRDCAAPASIQMVRRRCCRAHASSRAAAVCWLSRRPSYDVAQALPFPLIIRLRWYWQALRPP